jgi:putative component of toxin-antitoxin plasmid stabilization module
MRIRAYYFIRENGRAPFKEYLKTITDQRQLAAIQAVIEKLIVCDGRLPRPYAAHVERKIWELRTRFGNRVFYFIKEGPAIILLDGHTKKRDRIELRVLSRIRRLYAECIATKKFEPF